MNLSSYFLWLLLGPLLSTSLSGSEEQSWLKLSRNVDRRLLGNDNMEELPQKESEKKTELDEEVERIKHEIAKVQKDIKAVHHDNKVVKGYRGKPSRLQKLEKENQERLCWWPENFSHYAYAFAHDTVEGQDSLTGIHFQVPQNMKSFKFTKRPTNKGDFFLQAEEGLDIESLAYYFVTRITGQYYSQESLGTPGSLGIEQFRSRDVLYSGRNPPSEFPVNHKDHLFVMVTYSYDNPHEVLYRKLLSHNPPFSQVCRCSDMSDRVGAPVGLAVLAEAFENEGGFVVTTGGRRPAFPDTFSSVYDYFSDYNSDKVADEDYLTWKAPFLVCPLVPLEASRCY